MVSSQFALGVPSISILSRHPFVLKTSGHPGKAAGFGKERWLKMEKEPTPRFAHASKRRGSREPPPLTLFARTLFFWGGPCVWAQSDDLAPISRSGAGQQEGHQDQLGLLHPQSPEAGARPELALCCQIPPVFRGGIGGNTSRFSMVIPPFLAKGLT